jgi:alanine-synthesizing transaminase
LPVGKLSTGRLADSRPCRLHVAWAPIPEAYRQIGSVEFAKMLIDKADVAVSPGLGFGEYGEGYVRIALVENEHRITPGGHETSKSFSRAPPKPCIT